MYTKLRFSVLFQLYIPVLSVEKDAVVEAFNSNPNELYEYRSVIHILEGCKDYYKKQLCLLESEC